MDETKEKSSGQHTIVYIIQYQNNRNKQDMNQAQYKQTIQFKINTTRR